MVPVFFFHANVFVRYWLRHKQHIFTSLWGGAQNVTWPKYHPPIGSVLKCSHLYYLCNVFICSSVSNRIQFCNIRTPRTNRLSTSQLMSRVSEPVIANLVVYHLNNFPRVSRWDSWTGISCVCRTLLGPVWRWHLRLVGLLANTTWPNPPPPLALLKTYFMVYTYLESQFTPASIKAQILRDKSSEAKWLHSAI